MPVPKTPETATNSPSWWLTWPPGLFPTTKMRSSTPGARWPGEQRQGAGRQSDAGAETYRQGSRRLPADGRRSGYVKTDVAQIKGRLDKTDGRHDWIESNMLTKSQSADFMRATFGQLLSKRRIPEGMQTKHSKGTTCP